MSVYGWAALMACALALGACSRQERNDDCGATERVVDPVLLAFLSKARSAHHAADLREAEGDNAAALRTLQALAGGQTPPGNPPEVDEVLADTRARVADLLSRAGQFDQADVEVQAGLDHAKAASYFRGHLLEVRGLLEERREKDLRSKDRGQEADQARGRSLSAYEEAMKIQAQVISGIRSAVPTGAPSAAPHP